MATSKTIQSKLKKGVDDAIAARNKTRQRPRLAHLASLPTTNEKRLDLLSYVRKARDRLVHMAAKTAEVHAQIVKDQTEKFKRWGMVEGEKAGHWIDEIGQDKRIVARDRAIEKAKKEHATSTEGLRVDLITALRSVRADLTTAEPLTYSAVAMLLRSTNSDGERAKHMQILAGAGVIAIESAILDAIAGDGNRPLGAAIIQILEQDDKLASRVKYSREDVADQLMHNEYWAAQETTGITRYLIEQSEVAVLELEGKSISSDRKMRSGIMKGALEKAVGKTFNDEGYEIDPEGNVVKPVTSSGGSDDFYAKLEAESKARDAVVVAEKRKQAAAKQKANEDEITRIGNRSEYEENLKYGGADFAESMKS